VNNARAAVAHDRHRQVLGLGIARPHEHHEASVPEVILEAGCVVPFDNAVLDHLGEGRRRRAAANRRSGDGRHRAA
jgi:hypothetical protein